MEIVDMIKLRKDQGRLKIFIKMDSIEMKEIDVINQINNSGLVEKIEYIFNDEGNLVSVSGNIRY